MVEGDAASGTKTAHQKQRCHQTRRIYNVCKSLRLIWLFACMLFLPFYPYININVMLIFEKGRCLTKVAATPFIRTVFRSDPESVSAYYLYLAMTLYLHRILAFILKNTSQQLWRCRLSVGKHTGKKIYTKHTYRFAHTHEQ